MFDEKIIYSGKKIEDAEKALIMLHGRGAGAEDILSLSAHLLIKDFAVIAPQAKNNSWYPKSFLAPLGKTNRGCLLPWH